MPWQEHSLTPWERRAIHPEAPKEKLQGAYHDCREIVLSREQPGPPRPRGPFERLERSVLGYRVFGPRLGIPCLRQEPVQVGDTIGLRYGLLGPLDVFIASRVVEVFVREEEAGDLRSGFVYQTLQGHPEKGEEIFEVRKRASGEVTFKIEAWSRPKPLVCKVGNPHRTGHPETGGSIGPRLSPASGRPRGRTVTNLLHLLASFHPDTTRPV